VVLNARHETLPPGDRGDVGSPLLAFAAAPAFAAIIELGDTTTPLAKPVCPATGGCPIILTETTALQIQSDGMAYPTMAAHNGRIVAFTVSPASVSAADINGTAATKTKAAQPGLNATYGGASEVAITVLQPSSTKVSPSASTRSWPRARCSSSSPTSATSCSSSSISRCRSRRASSSR
jgi:hypothetical protein